MQFKNLGEQKKRNIENKFLSFKVPQIYHLQQIKQGINENPIIYVHRINAHRLKLYAAINQQTDINKEEKQNQGSLVDKVASQTLLVGLVGRVGSVVRASRYIYKTLQT